MAQKNIDFLTSEQWEIISDLIADTVGPFVREECEKLRAKIDELELKVARFESLNKLYSASHSRAVFNRGTELVGFGDD